MASEDSVIDLIESGDVDDYLDDIIQAAGERRKYLSTRLMRDLEEDDRVRVRPGVLGKRYLDGSVWIVAETPVGRTTKVVVRMAEESFEDHDPYLKYRHGGRVVMPAVALERVEG